MATRAKARVVAFPGTGTHLNENLKKARKRKPIGMQMKHDRDPAEDLFDKLGDLRKFKVLNTYVLYAIYERPKVTKGGIHLTDTTTSEDEYQGKAGLIVALGPMVNNDAKHRGCTFEVGTWIAVRPSAGWSITVNGVLCRMINEEHIHMVIPTPDSVW